MFCPYRLGKIYWIIFDIVVNGTHNREKLAIVRLHLIISSFKIIYAFFCFYFSFWKDKCPFLTANLNAAPGKKKKSMAWQLVIRSAAYNHHSDYHFPPLFKKQVLFKSERKKKTKQKKYQYLSELSLFKSSMPICHVVKIFIIAHNNLHENQRCLVYMQIHPSACPFVKSIIPRLQYPRRGWIGF